MDELPLLPNGTVKQSRSTGRGILLGSPAVHRDGFMYEEFDVGGSASHEF